MKQTIRLKTFETNSSSTHSISICGKYDKAKITFDKFKNTKIVDLDFGNIKKIYQGYLSYIIEAETDYEKAAFLLTMMGNDIEDELYDLVKPADVSDFDEREELRKSKFYEVSYVKALINAIKKTLGEDWNINVIFNSRCSPFISTNTDSNYSTYNILGLSEDQYKNIECLTNKLNEIIFNPDVIIKYVYEGND